MVRDFSTSLHFEVVVKNSFIDFPEENVPFMRRTASAPALQTTALSSTSSSRIASESVQKKIQLFDKIESFGKQTELLEPEWEPETKTSTKLVAVGHSSTKQCKLEQMKVGTDSTQKRRRRRRGSLIDVAYWSEKHGDAITMFCPWCGEKCDQACNFCRFCGGAVQ
jgi:hypothetical protein